MTRSTAGRGRGFTSTATTLSACRLAGGMDTSTVPGIGTMARITGIRIHTTIIPCGDTIHRISTILRMSQDTGILMDPLCIRTTRPGQSAIQGCPV